METASSLTRLFPLIRTDYYSRLKTECCPSTSSVDSEGTDDTDSVFARGRALKDDVEDDDTNNSILGRIKRHVSNPETHSSWNTNLVDVPFLKRSNDSRNFIGTFITRIRKASSDFGSFFDSHYEETDDIESVFARGRALKDDVEGDDANNAILGRIKRQGSNRKTHSPRNTSLLDVPLLTRSNDSHNSVGTFVTRIRKASLKYEKRSSNGALGNISLETTHVDQTDARPELLIVPSPSDMKLHEPTPGLETDTDPDESSAWFGCVIQYLVVTRRLKVCVVAAEDKEEQNADSKKFRRMFAKLRLMPGKIRKQTIPVTKWLDNYDSYKSKHGYFGVFSCAEFRKMDLEVKLYMDRGLLRRRRLLGEWTVSLQDCNFMDGLTVWRKIACGKRKASRITEDICQE